MVPPPFVLASGYYTGALLPVAILFSRRRSSISSSPTMESQRKPPPASSSSSTSLLAAASIDDAWDHGDGRRTRAAGKGKPRVLCLHGYCQSGRAFSNKIAGARRKLDRAYDLTFLDGPMLLPSTSAGDDDETDDTKDDDDGLLLLSPRGWWRRSEATGEYTHVREAFEYVLRHVEEEGETYDAVIGFSQGGTLATSLAVSGVLGPDLRAVVTAGAPYVDEAFVIASELRRSSSLPSSSSSSAPNDDEVEGCHDAVPKLHFAGSTDALVSMESTAELCRRGGGGTLVVHDRGHLFPTRSANVKEVLDFLDASLSIPSG